MKLILVLLFIAVSPHSFCQQEFAFKKFLIIDSVGKKQLEMDQDSSQVETTYLGKLDMKEGGFHSKSNTYHVLTRITVVSSANGKHGHSLLIFTDESGKTIKNYTFDLPEELPKGIKNNGLCFGEITLTYFSLPDLFCIPSGACFE